MFVYHALFVTFWQSSNLGLYLEWSNITFVFRRGTFANVCEVDIRGKGWCFGAVKPSLPSLWGRLAFAMSLSCVLCNESPTSRRAHLFCKHYLSRCITTGTLEEEGNLKIREIKPPYTTIISYCSFKLTCHPCDMLIFFLTKEINSRMRMAQITHKHLSSYKYLTFPVERFFIYSLKQSSLLKRLSPITVILSVVSSYSW